jgi:hypothetical protein
VTVPVGSPDGGPALKEFPWLSTVAKEPFT